MYHTLKLSLKADSSGFIVKLVITVVATFFMAADFPKIVEFFKKRIPEDKESPVKKSMGYIKDVIFIYIKSYSLLFSLTFIELSIGFLILRIPNAILLALAIAVFDILPVLGTGGILLPWMAILLIMDNLPLATGILVLYIIITAIRNTLEPKIVGNQIGLHPLVTLIAMVTGLKLIGIIGMMVFPVTLAIIVNLEKNGVIHILKNKEGFERY
ncbi:AI-2E family transporter [Lachnospiraceae bacterium 54-53]